MSEKLCFFCTLDWDTADDPLRFSPGLGGHFHEGCARDVVMSLEEQLEEAETALKDLEE